MRYLRLILLTFFVFLTCAPAQSRVLYGFDLPEPLLEAKAKARMNKEMLHDHPLLKAPHTINARDRVRPYEDRTGDFLVLLGLITVVGIFRFSNPTYFRSLFRAFRNQTLSTRQLKDQLRQNSAAGLFMDAIFCISIGLYLYYVIEHLKQSRLILEYPAFVIIPAFILLFLAIYLVRFLFLKFTGWVFNIPEITDNYTFNVFLINKVLGVLIIPFTVIMAFGEGPWVQVALFLSLLLIGILFLNRYLRSGIVFGYFIKFSKFHFFMYLCASELLPIAILVKALSRWFIS